MESQAIHLSELLSASDVATLLGVSISTLAIWRCTQRYPLPYLKVGRLVRYRRADIEKFLVERTVSGRGRL